MRKGSKKVSAKVNATATNESERQARARRPRGAPPANLERDRELRTIASKDGALRARLLFKKRCGTITLSEQVSLLSAHIDFGAVKTEQGQQGYASEIFKDAYQLGQELLRCGESPALLRGLFERLPKDLGKVLPDTHQPAPRIKRVKVLEPSKKVASQLKARRLINA